LGLQGFGRPDYRTIAETQSRDQEKLEEVQRNLEDIAGEIQSLLDVKIWQSRSYSQRKSTIVTNP
jgi:hypothetical protein